MGGNRVDLEDNHSNIVRPDYGDQIMEGPKSKL